MLLSQRSMRYGATSQRTPWQRVQWWLIPSFHLCCSRSRLHCPRSRWRYRLVCGRVCAAEWRRQAWPKTKWCVNETFDLLMVLTYLLSQLWFTLLDGSDEHIADSGSWQTVQTTSDAVNGNDVQVLTAWNSIKAKASMSIHNIQFAKLSRHSPVLSAQFMTAPTGQASEMRNLPPADPPRPETTRKNSLVSLSNKKIFCFFFLGSEKLNLAKFRNFSLYRRKFQRNSMRHGLVDVDDIISHWIDVGWPRLKRINRIYLS